MEEIPVPALVNNSRSIACRNSHFLASLLYVCSSRLKQPETCGLALRHQLEVVPCLCDTELAEASIFWYFRRSASWQEPFAATGRDGGTGRRSGLKIRRGQPRGGSTPPPGTNKIKDLPNQRIFGCVFLCPNCAQSLNSDPDKRPRSPG